jgi:hypothetical protein
MKFSEYIRKLDSSIVFDNLLESGSKRVFSDALYNGIEERFTSPQSIADRVAELSEHEKNSLTQILLSGSGGFEVTDSEERVNILKNFLAYQQRVMDTLRLAPFTDTTETTLKQLLNVEESSEPVTIYSGSTLDIALLVNLGENGTISYKQSGDLSKATIDSILPFTHFTKIAEQIKLPYSEQVLFLNEIIETLGKLSIFDSVDNKIEVSEENFNNWSILSDSELKEKLKETLLSSKSGFNAPLFTHLLENKKILVPQKFIIEGSTHLKKGFLILNWLGELSFESDKDENFICKTAVASLESIETGQIMPDFSTFIPREITAKKLNQFLQIGSVTSLDMVYQAKIEKAKVLDALARGVDGQNILDLITEWRGATNLITSVEEWIRHFEELFFDVPYLALKSHLAETVLKVPELNSLLEPVTDYKMYRIKDGSSQRVDKIINGLGYDLRLPTATKGSGNFKSRLSNSQPLITADFSPVLKTIEKQANAYVGKYSGSLRKLSMGEMQKIMKYAIFMEERLTLLIKEEEVIVMPLNVKLGEPAILECSNSVGTVNHIPLDTIEKMGVIRDA